MTPRHSDLDVSPVVLDIEVVALSEWPDYLERMRQGLKDHGQVREGVYAATGYEGVEVHDARLKHEREKR